MCRLLSAFSGSLQNFDLWRRYNHALSHHPSPSRAATTSCQTTPKRPVVCTRLTLPAVELPRSLYGVTWSPMEVVGHCCHPMMQQAAILTPRLRLLRAVSVLTVPRPYTRSLASLTPSRETTNWSFVTTRKPQNLDRSTHGLQLPRPPAPWMQAEPVVALPTGR